MTQHHFTLRERIRYRFDNLLSRGTGGMVLVLFGFTFLFLVLAALVISILQIRNNEDQSLSFGEALWQSMLRAIDAGTIGGDTPWGFRFIGLAITVMGIFVVSALIGILASGLDSRLASLQRGRGRIAVAGHTLVLGWSPKVMTILAELAIAKESQKDGTVVVLADRDKQWMDEMIGARLDDLRGLKVVTRNGQPQEPTDLSIVNPDLASSIIVLSDADAAGDAGVVKTVLALLSDSRIPASTTVVAEVESGARAQALRSVTPEQVVVVEPGELIARAAAQSSRETGLSLVLEELFQFQGSEIYFADVPEARGMAFGDALNCFQHSSLIGIIAADGALRLNPPADTVIGESDGLMLISHDDSAIAWTGPMTTTALMPDATHQRYDRTPETIAMFGWSDLGRAIVSHLDSYVPPGSSLTLVTDPQILPSVSVPSGLHNLTVETLEMIDVDDPVGTVLGRIECDHVLILCYRNQDISAEEAESRVLTTFLEIRDRLARLGRQANVTAELLDERDVDLIPSASAGEFMVSEKLASLIITQLSENIALESVFSELLDPSGSEIYCKPIELYCTPGPTVRFADLVETAKARGEVAIGWRVARLHRDREHGFGVVVNPDKTREISFAAGDQLVVLARDDD